MAAPIVQSMGSGYYNYYKLSYRYSCETPHESWYRRDLSKAEISNNNDILNKDSQNADLYRKLEDTYASVAISNRAKYDTVDELRNALYAKYSAQGAYAKYSKEERNAMYLNELSATCFGTIGNYTGMGGGDILADPHLKGSVSETNITDQREYGRRMLNAQIQNVFTNHGVDTALFGDTRFSFQLDPLTKYVRVAVSKQDAAAQANASLLAQMEKALNSRNNGKNLFYNLLSERSRAGNVPKDALAKFRLMNTFYSETGLDIRTFTQTKNGFFNADGRNALDLYRAGLETSRNVPQRYKGTAYDYFKELIQNAMQYELSGVKNLTLTADYQNGALILTGRDTVSGSNVDYSV